MMGSIAITSFSVNGFCMDRSEIITMCKAIRGSEQWQ